MNWYFTDIREKLISLGCLQQRQNRTPKLLHLDWVFDHFCICSVSFQSKHWQTVSIPWGWPWRRRSLLIPGSPWQCSTRTTTRMKPRPSRLHWPGLKCYCHHTHLNCRRDQGKCVNAVRTPLNSTLYERSLNV